MKWIILRGGLMPPNRLWKWSLFTLLSTMLALSCGEPVEDINRVQPHYLKKSDLEGVWYARMTIVDHPSTVQFAFTGIEGPLEKIKWEIRENRLIARRAFEPVVGLNSQAQLDGGELIGNPVAIYPITTHFDVIRDFNRSTGQQSNVVRENTSLNPWYEREYLRVDWTRNEVVGALKLFDIRVGAESTGAGALHRWFREDEADNPNHLQLTPDYISVTTAQTLSDGGAGCYYSYSSPTLGSANCGPAEVLMRSAFVKVKASEESQFQPHSYLDREQLADDAGNVLSYAEVAVGPDRTATAEVACTPEVLEALEGELIPSDCQELKWDHFGRFGYFRTERRAYDRRVGSNHDEQRIYYANHHQMWQETIDADGELIPFERRTLRPIVYYLNPHFPDDLKLMAVKVMNDWNNAFMQAASNATRRDAEELRAELSEYADLKRERAVYLRGPDGDEVGRDALFQVRENSCSVQGIGLYLDDYPQFEEYLKVLPSGGDPDEIQPGELERACALLRYHSQRELPEDSFVWQQMGDPRFSFLWWIVEDQPVGPLGYGPSSADPESGQIISGNAYIYGGAIDRYARSATDLVRAVNGDLCAEFGMDSGDVSCAIRGEDFKNWVAQGSASVAQHQPVSADFHRSVSQRLGVNPQGEMAGDHPAAISAALRHLRRRVTLPDASDRLQHVTERQGQDHQKWVEAIKSDPMIRARLVTPEILKLVNPLFGLSPDDEPTEEASDFALEWTLNPRGALSRYESRKRYLAEHNVKNEHGWLKSYPNKCDVNFLFSPLPPPIFGPIPI